MSKINEVEKDIFTLINKINFFGNTTKWIHKKVEVIGKSIN